jgi:hypothetical protein
MTVGAQALILSAKEFQNLNVLPDSMTFEQLLDCQYTPFDPPPLLLRQVSLLGFSAILWSVPFGGAVKKWGFSTLDKVKNTPLDQFLDQIYLIAI